MHNGVVTQLVCDSSDWTARAVLDPVLKLVRPQGSILPPGPCPLPLHPASGILGVETIVLSETKLAEADNMSMQTRGAASSRYRRGGTSFQGNISRSWRGGSVSTTGGKESGMEKEKRYEDLPSSNLIIEFTASDIQPTDGPTRISNFDCIASYNWLSCSEPTILVPGSYVPIPRISIAS